MTYREPVSIGPDPTRQRYRYCLDARGNRLRLSAGRWHGQRSYEATWELLGALADQLCLSEQMQAQAQQQFLLWDPAAMPGSDTEARMLIGTQMTVAAVELRHLAAATVLVAGPGAAGAELVAADAHTLAPLVELPADPVYLDLVSADQRTSPALEIGGRRWPLTGALAHRAGGCLIVVPFGAAEPDTVPGPAGQPLARVIYGPAGRLPQPNPGEVCVDTASGQPLTPALLHPESKLTARLHAAVELAGSAVSILRRLNAPDVTLSDRAPRQMRRSAQRAGERIAFTLTVSPPAP